MSLSLSHAGQEAISFVTFASYLFLSHTLDKRIALVADSSCARAMIVRERMSSLQPVLIVSWEYSRCVLVSGDEVKVCFGGG